MDSQKKFWNIIQYLSLISFSAYLSLHIIDVNIPPRTKALFILFPLATSLIFITQNLLRNDLKRYLLILCLFFTMCNTFYLLYAPSQNQKDGAIITLMSFFLASVSIGVSIANERKS